MIFFILLFAAKCEVGKKTYAINQTYLTSDCKRNCTCEFANGTAILNCSPLCATPDDPECIENTQQVEEYQQTFAESNCSCPAKRCIPGLKLFRSIQLQIVSKSLLLESICSKVAIWLRSYEESVWKVCSNSPLNTLKQCFFSVFVINFEQVFALGLFFTTMVSIKLS